MNWLELAVSRGITIDGYAMSIDPSNRVIRGIWGVLCEDGHVRILPDKYRLRVIQWIEMENSAVIEFSWPALDEPQIIITANVAAEELAMHSRPE